jgi:hypothetical protein
MRRVHTGQSHSALPALRRARQRARQPDHRPHRRPRDRPLAQLRRRSGGRPCLIWRSPHDCPWAPGCAGVAAATPRPELRIVAHEPARIATPPVGQMHIASIRRCPATIELRTAVRSLRRGLEKRPPDPSTGHDVDRYATLQLSQSSRGTRFQRVARLRLLTSRCTVLQRRRSPSGADPCPPHPRLQPPTPAASRSISMTH